MVALAYLTTVLTIVRAGFLHLEPESEELRRLDPGPALAVLDDSALAASCCPKELSPVRRAPGFAALALLALAVSVMSVGYAIRNPWTHPWILDALEHLDLYTSDSVGLL